MPCPHHHYHWHTPHPDLERASESEGETDPAWSHHSRWICQICLLGLMEMLSGKCNDLCGIVCACVRVCLPLNPLFQLPWVCLGKTQSLCCDRQAGRDGYNSESPFLIERPERGNRRTKTLSFICLLKWQIINDFGWQDGSTKTVLYNQLCALGAPSSAWVICVKFNGFYSRCGLKSHDLDSSRTKPQTWRL